MNFSVLNDEGHVTCACVYCCLMINQERTSEDPFLIPAIDHIQVKLYLRRYALVVDGYVGSYLSKT